MGFAFDSEIMARVDAPMVDGMSSARLLSMLGSCRRLGTCCIGERGAGWRRRQARPQER